MSITRRAFGGLAAYSALALAGCGDAGPPPPRLLGSGAPGPRRGGVLTTSIYDDLRHFDPAVNWDEFANPFFDALYDKLLDYAPAMAPEPARVIPGLAERWTVDDGGTRYTFHLREGVRFSNGEPLVAEDFVFALNRILDPGVGSPGAQFYGGIQGAQDRVNGKADRVAGARAAGERTLEIRLDAPDPSFLYVVALPFMTPLKQRDSAAIRDEPIGTGPFMLREWQRGTSVTLERNPHYWDRERPYLDGIRVDLFVPRSVAALRFLKGELDTFERLNADDFTRIAASPDWQGYCDRIQETGVLRLDMNTTRAPFNDVRVRRALNLAIQKDDLIRLLNGLGKVANGMVPPGIPGHQPERPPYPYDPVEARRLLIEAGHERGLDISLLINVEDVARLVAQSIKADLAKIGVRLQILEMTWAAISSLVNRRDFDAVFVGWWMDFPDPWDVLALFHSRMIAAENGLNWTHYSNPEYDRLLDEGHREMDDEKRVAIYRRADEIIYKDCPVVFLYFPEAVDVRQPRLMGFRRHPFRLRAFRHAWLDLPAA